MPHQSRPRWIEGLRNFATGQLEAATDWLRSSPTDKPTSPAVSVRRRPVLAGYRKGRYSPARRVGGRRRAQPQQIIDPSTVAASPAVVLKGRRSLPDWLWREVVLAGVVGLTVGLTVYGVQFFVEGERIAASTRIENVRYVRDRSSPDPSLDRPFEGLDLTRQNLSGLDLAGANFRSAQLAGSSLNGTKLPGASLDGANLSGSHFTGADLTRAGLVSAELSNAVGYDVTLIGANLSGAKLTGVRLSGSLTGTNFHDAVLDHASLSGADLTAASFTGAHLVEAELNKATLSRAYFGSTTDMFLADLTEANLFRADLSGARLFRANLTRANLAEADVSGADLRQTNLTGVDLSQACWAHTPPIVDWGVTVPPASRTGDCDYE